MPSIVASSLTRLDDILTITDPRLAFPADTPDGYVNGAECYVNGPEAALGGEVAIKGQLRAQEGVIIGSLAEEWWPAFNSPLLITQSDADGALSVSLLLLADNGSVQFVPSENLRGTADKPRYIEFNGAYLLASSVSS